MKHDGKERACGERVGGSYSVTNGTVLSAGIKMK